MKKFISALIVTAMMIPTAVPMTALADNAVNNSVSGYILLIQVLSLSEKTSKLKFMLTAMIMRV